MSRWELRSSPSTGWQSDPVWEAHWTGDKLRRPIGPFGVQVGVINTSRSKAQRCVDYFNDQINRGETK